MNERISSTPPLQIGLNAAIISISGGEPMMLLAEKSDVTQSVGLPYGAFNPEQHRTFEMSLRSLVEEQTAFPLGYVEQLYTFGDRGRLAPAEDNGAHIVSVGYLALTRPDSQRAEQIAETGAQWSAWYTHFPWENWREGRPAVLDAIIIPALKTWAEAAPDDRWVRAKMAFGLDNLPFDDERVLERYELLYEAGLVREAVTDGRASMPAIEPDLGRPLHADHRRIMATAMARLRGKIKYRPVIFELMPPDFTLTELQETVEAIAGKSVHKQNFRRLVDGAALVEPTGAMANATGGRPAALYRFRREIFGERPAPGLRVGGRSQLAAKSAHS